MNKKLAFAMPLSLVLIACGGPKDTTTTRCVEIDIPAQCVRRNSITINYQSHIVAPPHICADRTKPIKVRVTPADGPVRSVTTWPKLNHPDHTWLKGTNDPDPNRFKLIPPPGIPEGEYDYGVTFEDGFCIDPRISLR